MNFLLQRCWYCLNRTFSEKPLCKDCQRQLCQKIKIRAHWLQKGELTMTAITFLDFSDPFVRQIILTLKSSERVAPVHYLVDQLLRHYLLRKGVAPVADLVVPVPSASGRRHAHLISEAMAGMIDGISFDPVQTHSLRQQKALTASARLEKTFTSVFEDPPSLPLLIVDDLLVTGGSILAVARALGINRGQAMALAFQPKELESKPIF